jgi:hypothetical protein
MGLFDAVLEPVFGGASGAEKQLGRISTAGFEDDTVQGFLPPSLRLGNTTDFLTSGVQSIGELIKNPGRLNPNIAEAIAPRVAAESERLAQNFQGIRQNQAGSLARTNAPVSIKNALSTALDIAQSRAQRDIRRGAQLDSENLRRADLGQLFPLFDALLQFTSAGKGTAVQGLGQAAQLAQSRQAANQQFVGSLLTGGAIPTGGKAPPVIT